MKKDATIIPFIIPTADAASEFSLARNLFRVDEKNVYVPPAYLNQNLLEHIENLQTENLGSIKKK